MPAQVPCLSLLRLPQLWKAKQLFVYFVVEYYRPVLFRCRLPQHWSIAFSLNCHLSFFLEFHAIGFAEDRVAHAWLSLLRFIEASITCTPSISDPFRHSHPFLLSSSHALAHALGKAPILSNPLIYFDLILTSFYWIVKWATIITFVEITTLLAALIYVHSEILLSTVSWRFVNLRSQHRVFVEVVRIYLSHIFLSAPKVSHFDERTYASGASRNYFLKYLTKVVLFAMVWLCRWLG